jgi:predicted nucleic acid-binding protein
MSARALIDTNVLVYAYDRSEPTRQQQALDVLDRLALTGAGAITTQVLAEFFVTVTRKLVAPLNVADAYVRVENYLRVWTVYDLSGLVVLEAARGVRDHQLNFWDAQIWAAARLNQLPVVFSEDFNVGTTLEGVRFVNPFDPAFQLADWV